MPVAIGSQLVPGTHGTTYGGNPLACAAGNAVLDVITGPGFLDAVVAKGKRLQEVADDLNVSLNTVRNQLKQAFSKTSTNRQADLVSLVLTSVADLAQDGRPPDEPSS